MCVDVLSLLLHHDSSLFYLFVLYVGAVLMVTPLHPIGHAMAIGGCVALATEFEKPKQICDNMIRKTNSIWKKKEDHPSSTDNKEEEGDSSSTLLTTASSRVKAQNQYLDSPPTRTTTLKAKGTTVGPDAMPDVTFCRSWGSTSSSSSSSSTTTHLSKKI